MSKASNVYVNIQSNTDRTFYAVWTWNKNNLDYFSIKWYYHTGNGVWFLGNDSTSNIRQSLYTPPSNALKIKFKVKPVSKKHTVNGKETSYWTADWSTEVVFSLESATSGPPSPIINLPQVPSVPTLDMSSYTLTSELDVYDEYTDYVEFQVVKNDLTVTKTGRALKTTNHVSFACKVEAGGEYKVRCRGGNSYGYSEWSQYSQNIGTIPSPPSKITSCKSASATSVKLTWTTSVNATSYEIEYTTKKSYFDSTSQVSSMTVPASINYAQVLGLDSGEEWFFRVRAVNSIGESGWCSPASTVIGKVPSAPTTWSETTTVTVGDTVSLYWVHNSEDGSDQTSAEIRLIIGGVTTVISYNDTVDGNETSFYLLTTSSYSEGATIKWSVRTKGIINQFGPWSVQRSIIVYAPPTLSLTLSNSNNWYWDLFEFKKDNIYTASGESGPTIETLLSFPLIVTAICGESSQTPVGYFMAVYSKRTYQTTDQIGNAIRVKAGEKVYSKSVDLTKKNVVFGITPSDILLENNVEYTVKCTVSMNSGLSADASSDFLVSWKDDEYDINAEIGFDSDELSAHIRPYCEDDSGEIEQGVLMSVYRREFDGSFTEIATRIDPVLMTFVTDPHPSFDYARYRIVAVSKATGAISYYDVPGYPTGVKYVAIQWAEEWSNFDVTSEEPPEQPSWAGSILKLPYNIDVSDKYDIDKSLIEYIGREHPVSYYGTQLGHTSTWNVDVPKDDVDTLYALRRLSIWKGDVYVREPSGSGYWANISISFGQKHRELVIPVSIDVTRVEGGV